MRNRFFRDFGLQDLKDPEASLFFFFWAMKNETFLSGFRVFVISRFGDSEASLIFCSNEKWNFFSDFGIFRDPDFFFNSQKNI